MGRHETLIRRILDGRSDANISFDELCSLLQHLGFQERSRGSHFIYRRSGIEERINLHETGETLSPIRFGKLEPSSSSTTWEATSDASVRSHHLLERRG